MSPEQIKYYQEYIEDLKLEIEAKFIDEYYRQQHDFEEVPCQL